MKNISNIKIERGILNKVGENINDIYHGKNIYIITDDNVAPLYSDKVISNLKCAGFRTFLHIIKAGEESKNFTELQGIYKFLIESGAARSDLLIALGGGVIGDMAGFAAATYMRGISYVQIPTTLTAQIDSSIGGKVAVNLPQGKNLAGAFYHPLLILIDPECLETLPEKVLSDGAAEAVKYAYIKDVRLYDIFKQVKCIKDIFIYIDEIIFRCCEIKRVVVENDEREAGERMILNFGHTVGHAYESYYNYKKYTHGEAVALGMAAICAVSEDIGLAPEGVTYDLKNILKNLGLPREDIEADKKEVLKNIYKDKKSNSEYINLVLLKNIGKVVIKRVPVDEIEGFFEGFVGK